MPQLPEYQSPVDPTPDQPPAADVNPWQRGATAKAASAFGFGVADVTAKIIGQLKQASDADAVTEKHKQYLLDLQMIEDDARKNSGEGSVGYAKTVSEWIDQRAKEDQETLPSDEARRAYIQTVGTTMTRHVMEARNKELSDSVAFFSTSRERNASKVGTIAVQGPLLVKGVYETDRYLRKISDLVRADLEGIAAKEPVFGKKAVFDESNKYSASVATSVANGLFETEQYDTLMSLLMNSWTEKPNEGLIEKMEMEYFISGLDAALENQLITKDEYDKQKADAEKNKSKIKLLIPKEASLKFGEAGIDENLLNKMDPDERARYIAKVNDALKSKSKEKLSDFYTTFQGVNAQLKDKPGKIPDDLIAKIRAYEARKIFSPERARTLIDELKVSQRIGYSVEKLKTAPLSQHQKIIDAQTTGGADALGRNYQERIQARNYLQAKSDEINVRLRKDPVEYLNEVHPDLARLQKEAEKNPALVQTLRAKTEAKAVAIGLNPLSARLLTNAARDTLALRVEKAQNAEEIQQILAPTLQREGRFASRVLDEVAEEHKSMKAFRTAMHSASKYDQQNIIGAAGKEGEAREEIFKKKYDANQQKNLIGAVNKLMDKWRPSMGATEYDDTRKKVERIAMQYKMEGDSDRDAAEKAEKSISNTYANFPNKQMEGVRSRRVFSDGTPLNESAVSQTLSWYLDAKNVSRAVQFGEIALPDGEATGAFAQLSKEGKIEQWSAHLEKNAYWKSLPGADRAILLYRNAEGIERAVLDSRGKPVTMEFQSLSKGNLPKSMLPGEPPKPVLKKKIEPAPAVPGKAKRKPASGRNELNEPMLETEELE